MQRVAFIVDDVLVPLGCKRRTYYWFLAAVCQARYNLPVVKWRPGRVVGVNDWNRGDGLAQQEGGVWRLAGSEAEEEVLRAIAGLPEDWREEVEAIAEAAARRHAAAQRR